LLKSCYGDYAYLYASDNSVYNVSTITRCTLSFLTELVLDLHCEQVTLANYTRLNSTPKLTRHVFELLDSK
jgi:hypothetical protein